MPVYSGYKSISPLRRASKAIIVPPSARRRSTLISVLASIKSASILPIITLSVASLEPMRISGRFTSSRPSKNPPLIRMMHAATARVFLRWLLICSIVVVDIFLEAGCNETGVTAVSILLITKSIKSARQQAGIAPARIMAELSVWIPLKTSVPSPPAPM